MTEKTAEFEGIDTQSEAVVPEVIHVVRTLAEVSNPTDKNILGANDLNLHLTSYVHAGYVLHSTHFLGMNEKGIMVLYIMAKKPTRRTPAKKTT